MGTGATFGWGCAGGLFAYVLVGDAQHAKQAIAYGMGWEAVAKGLGAAGAAAVAKIGGD